MSTHRVEVVKLGPVRKHPNADSLGLVDVWGYTCAVRIGEWKTGDLAAYIEPDYVVPDDERFAFLKGHRRIKPVRLRGQWSQGLLVRPPDGAVEGDDVMAALGVERYEPPEPRQLGARLGNPRTDFTTRRQGASRSTTSSRGADTLGF
jgi:RNA ligase (TIGR02306 family)